MYKPLLPLVCVASLVGCAIPYHAAQYRAVGPFGGGYEELQLSENVFRVSFDGNSYTDKREAADYALLRSAEVAQQHGFSFFAVVDAENENRGSTMTTPVQTQTTAIPDSTGKVTTITTTTGGETFVSHLPSTSNLIMCFREKPADFRGVIYEPAFLIRSIRDAYGFDKPTAATKTPARKPGPPWAT